MSKDRRLGRGLAALLGTPLEDELHAEAIASTPEWSSAAPAVSTPDTGLPTPDNGGLLQLAVDAIEENPFQPRRDFSDVEIASLAESLKEHDMLQPVLVRRVEGRYQLISGERRLRAARLAGWTTIPARVRDADDRLVAELAIVENFQRKDLNPLEKATSFQRYLEQFGCTQEELAGRLQMNRSTVANLIRLLELPSEVQKAVSSGAIAEGHARALLPLGEEREQVAMCRQVIADGLSVRRVEELVRETVQVADTGPLGVVYPDDGAKATTTKRTRSGHV